MEENKIVCCPKTRVRLEAIKRNEVEGLEVVDNIIVLKEKAYPRG